MQQPVGEVCLRETADMGFPSLLFPHAAPRPDTAEPLYFRDLNLDQVVASATAGKHEYALEPFFHALPGDAGVVRFRQAVMRELEEASLRWILTRFARRMRDVRATVVQAEQSYYRMQRQRLLLDAIVLYCGGVSELNQSLSEHGTPDSDGLNGFRDSLADYVASERFAQLYDGVRELLDALARVRYCVLLTDDRVSVRNSGEEPDYAPQIERTFARFRQQQASKHDFGLPDPPQMNHVEAQILEGVASLNPALFADIETFCARHAAPGAALETGGTADFARYPFIEDGIAIFDREIQFYLAWLEFIAPMRRTGLSFVYPELAETGREVHAEGAFDIALAAKLLAENRTPVVNDVRLAAGEQLIVVTGPNQGGKTTFARTFGQLHHLGGLGCSVPGMDVRLGLCDRIYTHFEQRERLATRHGKLEDELVRLHDTLAEATANSILVLNEIFDSTTYHDALYLSRWILARVLELGARCVWVTFLDELSRYDEKVVSMVSSTLFGDPTARTYKIERRAADGLAYALSLAEKHGLSRTALLHRLPS